MKKSRIWVFAALLLTLSLVLAACGPEIEEPHGDDMPIDDGGIPEEEPVDESAGVSEEVKVGVLFGVSGPIAVYGESQTNGVRLAVNAINESGYLGDLTLVAVYEDTTSDAEGAIAAMTKVIEEDGVVAVLGPTLSTHAFAADPIAQEAGVPVMGVSNTASGITDMGNFVFRNSLPESAVIPGTISQSKELLGLETVGILWGNDDDFTSSSHDVFAAAVADSGLEVVADETFATGDVDFNAQLTNILAGEPDALVVSALAQEGALIIVQARAQGFTGAIISGNGFNSPAIAEQAGADSNGVIVGAAWNIASSNPLSTDFVASFEAEYGSLPDQFATQSYTGMWLIATAIKDAGSTDPAAIRDALAAITGYDSPLGSFSFDADRNPVHDPVVQVLIDGLFEVLTADNAP